MALLSPPPLPTRRPPHKLAKYENPIAEKTAPKVEEQVVEAAAVPAAQPTELAASPPPPLITGSTEPASKPTARKYTPKDQ